MSHKIIRPHENDQISCRLTSDRKKIEFRMGGEGRGEASLAHLTPKEALAMAAELILFVEKNFLND